MLLCLMIEVMQNVKHYLMLGTKTVYEMTCIISRPQKIYGGSVALVTRVLDLPYKDPRFKLSFSLTLDGFVP